MSAVGEGDAAKKTKLVASKSKANNPERVKGKEGKKPVATSTSTVKEKTLQPPNALQNSTQDQPTLSNTNDSCSSTVMSVNVSNASSSTGILPQDTSSSASGVARKKKRVAKFVSKLDGLLGDEDSSPLPKEPYVATIDPAARARDAEGRGTNSELSSRKSTAAAELKPSKGKPTNARASVTSVCSNYENVLKNVNRPSIAKSATNETNGSGHGACAAVSKNTNKSDASKRASRLSSDCLYRGVNKPVSHRITLMNTDAILDQSPGSDGADTTDKNVEHLVKPAKKDAVKSNGAQKENKKPPASVFVLDASASVPSFERHALNDSRSTTNESSMTLFNASVSVAHNSAEQALQLKSAAKENKSITEGCKEGKPLANQDQMDKVKRDVTALSGANNTCSSLTLSDVSNASCYADSLLPAHAQNQTAAHTTGAVRKKANGPSAAERARLLTAMMNQLEISGDENLPIPPNRLGAPQSVNVSARPTASEPDKKKQQIATGGETSKQKATDEPLTKDVACEAYLCCDHVDIGFSRQTEPKFDSSESSATSMLSEAMWNDGLQDTSCTDAAQKPTALSVSNGLKSATEPVECVERSKSTINNSVKLAQKESSHSGRCGDDGSEAQADAICTVMALNQIDSSEPEACKVGTDCAEGMGKTGKSLDASGEPDVSELVQSKLEQSEYVTEVSVRNVSIQASVLCDDDDFSDYSVLTPSDKIPQKHVPEHSAMDNSQLAEGSATETDPSVRNVSIQASIQFDEDSTSRESILESTRRESQALLANKASMPALQECAAAQDLAGSKDARSVVQKQTLPTRQRMPPHEVLGSPIPFTVGALGGGRKATCFGDKTTDSAASLQVYTNVDGGDPPATSIDTTVTDQTSISQHPNIFASTQRLSDAPLSELDLLPDISPIDSRAHGGGGWREKRRASKRVSMCAEASMDSPGDLFSSLKGSGGRGARRRSWLPAVLIGNTDDEEELVEESEGEEEDECIEDVDTSGTTDLHYHTAHQDGFDCIADSLDEETWGEQGRERAGRHEEGGGDDVREVGESLAAVKEGGEGDEELESQKYDINEKKNDVEVVTRGGKGNGRSEAVGAAGGGGRIENKKNVAAERESGDDWRDRKIARPSKLLKYNDSSDDDDDVAFENFLSKVKGSAPATNQRNPYVDEAKPRRRQTSNNDDSLNAFVVSDDNVTSTDDSSQEEGSNDGRGSDTSDLESSVEGNMTPLAGGNRYGALSPSDEELLGDGLAGLNISRGRAVADVTAKGDGATTNASLRGVREGSPALAGGTATSRVDTRGNDEFLRPPVPPLRTKSNTDDFRTPDVPRQRTRDLRTLAHTTGHAPRGAGGSAAPLSFLASLSLNTRLEARDSDAKRYIAQFSNEAVRAELTARLFKLFNEHIFNKQLPADMLVTWNDRMTKSAGYCSYRRASNDPSSPHTASIQLSGKVCDNPERLRDTLIHEMCHAAVWIVNGLKEGHGKHWKCWQESYKASIEFRELPPISRCHSYDINTKYIYECTQCHYQIGRHSRSLDVERKVCGYCRGTFALLLRSKSSIGGSASATPQRLALPYPSPGGNGGTPYTPRTPNRFALFVKENYKEVQRCMPPGSDMKVVMGEVKRRYDEHKAALN